MYMRMFSCDYVYVHSDFCDIGTVHSIIFTQVVKSSKNACERAARICCRQNMYLHTPIPTTFSNKN